MSVRTLVEEFSALEDPRCGGKVEHRLIDILVIAVCAVIAGAESWEDIALYGRSKIGWLGTFLALPNGIPAHDTFRRVFMLIDTGRFERCFEAWVRSFGAPVDREVVAIDGKTIRGSFDRGREPGPLHVVSAWACDRRLVLGQRQVSDKSNEITAIPELLDVLDIKGDRHPGCDGLPAGDRHQNPRERGGLSGDAQGEPGEEIHCCPRALRRDLFQPLAPPPAGP